MTKSRKPYRLWRADQLLAKYGAIDQANDPGLELRKFAWLRSEDIISVEDFEHIKRQLTSEM